MTDPTTMAAELEALQVKATAGPWSIDEVDKGVSAHILGAPNGFCADILGTLPMNWPESEANAALIAAAVNALPTLLAALKAREEALVAAGAWFEAAGVADLGGEEGVTWLNEGGWDLEAPRVAGLIRTAIEGKPA